MDEDLQSVKYIEIVPLDDPERRDSSSSSKTGANSSPDVICSPPGIKVGTCIVHYLLVGAFGGGLV